MLNREGNLRNFAEAGRLPILARKRSMKNSVSVRDERSGQLSADTGSEDLNSREQIFSHLNNIVQESMFMYFVKQFEIKCFDEFHANVIIE